MHTRTEKPTEPSERESTADTCCFSGTNTSLLPHLLRPKVQLFWLKVFAFRFLFFLPCCPSGQHHVQLATEHSASKRAAPTTLRIRNVHRSAALFSESHSCDCVAKTKRTRPMDSKEHLVALGQKRAAKWQESSKWLVPKLKAKQSPWKLIIWRPRRWEF